MIPTPIIGSKVRTLEDMTLEELKRFSVWLEWATWKTEAMNKPTEELEKLAANVEETIRKLGENNETTDR